MCVCRYTEAKSLGEKVKGSRLSISEFKTGINDYINYYNITLLSHTDKLKSLLEKARVANGLCVIKTIIIY